MTDLLKRFWRDERGEMGALEKLLILAFIVVPLVILLIMFKDDIIEWAQGQWGTLFENESGANPDSSGK
jgi:Flp pilus assembly pilin Flp